MGEDEMSILKINNGIDSDELKKACERNTKKSNKCKACKGSGAKWYNTGDMMDEDYVWEGNKPTEDVCNVCHGSGMGEI